MPELDAAAVTVASDICALPLARRLAALLDRDPGSLREGDPLPHGWHAMLFNLPTRQCDLRDDGSADLGVPLPDIGLPRLMLGGRHNRFPGEIPIGAHLKRETRRGAVQLKEGRSGRFALVAVEHRLFVEGQDQPAVVEQLDYMLREANRPPASAAAPDVSDPAKVTAAALASAPVTSSALPSPIATRVLLPDERLLFRYSAITDNPHRIHYDRSYATEQEGYPALIVNGSLPAMFLLEMFRRHIGREPRTFSSRNLAPMFCAKPLTLKLARDEQAWRLWAEDEQGRTTFDARAE